MAGNQGVADYNSLELVVNRIAPDPAALHFFVDRGLPQNPEIAREAGQFQAGASPLWKDTRLLVWVHDDFKSTYASYLLHHPIHTLIEPYRKALIYVSSGSLGTARPVLPSTIDEMLWASSQGDVALWLGVTVVLASAALMRRVRVRGAAVCALLFALAAEGAFLSWHTGSADFPRIFVPTGLAVRLAMFLTIAFGLDALSRKGALESVEHAPIRTDTAGSVAHTTPRTREEIS